MHASGVVIAGHHHGGAKLLHKELDRRHCVSISQFAQAPDFNHLIAAYNAFDFSGPLDFVKKAADLSDRVDRGRVDWDAGGGSGPFARAASSLIVYAIYRSHCQYRKMRL